MKRSTFLTFLSIAFVSGMILISSCTKEGPAGLTGAEGPQGPAGEDGINGTDGTAGCVACHDGGQDQGMFAQETQWEASTHATGGTFSYTEGHYQVCSTCHTSQGFLENLETGAGTASISNPNPVNCYTCHNIHETYTGADLALTTTSAVTLMTNGAVIDLGKGNLCANCHQNRVANPMPVLGGPDVTIGANAHWGIHYGAQGPMVAGTGAFEFGTGYISSVHKSIENTCVDCHMSEAFGAKAGGHTMKMSYSNWGQSTLRTVGCVACHPNSTALNAKVAATATEIDGLEADLKAALITAGVFDEDGEIIGQTMSATKAAAALNYYFVHYDGSHGVHNYEYAKILLTNTIAELAK